MIAFRDFAPKTAERSWYQSAAYENFSAAVAEANEWIAANKITPLHIETVVLPDVHAPGQEGTEDTDIRTFSGHASWNQFLRIWYFA